MAEVVDVIQGLRVGNIREGNPPETVVLSVKLYSRRLTRELYSCCIWTVVHAAV